MPTQRTIYLEEEKPNDYAPPAAVAVVEEENVNLNVFMGNNIVLATDPSYMFNQGALAQYNSIPNVMKNSASGSGPSHHTTSSAHAGALNLSPASKLTDSTPPKMQRINIESQSLPPVSFYNFSHWSQQDKLKQQMLRNQIAAQQLQHTVVIPNVRMDMSRNDIPSMSISGQVIPGHQHLQQQRGQMILIQQPNPVVPKQQVAKFLPSLDDIIKKNSMKSNSATTVTHPGNERKNVPSPKVLAREVKQIQRPTGANLTDDNNTAKKGNIKKDSSNDIRRSKEKPRRPLNAYNFYFSEEREIILEEVQFALSQRNKSGEDTHALDGAKSSPIGISNEELEKILESPPTLPPDFLNDVKSKVHKKTLQVLNARRESDKAKKAPHRKTHGIGFRPLSMAIARRWKTLGIERKKHYKNLAKMDLERYTSDMNDFAQKMLNSTKTADE